MDEAIQDLTAANSDHGDAFYMLTGTTDFDYVLDLMVLKGQIDQATADTY